MTRARVDEQRAREQRAADLADEREYYRQQQDDQRRYAQDREREKMILGIMEKTGLSREEATAALDSGEFGKVITDNERARALETDKAKFLQSRQFNEVNELNQTSDEIAKAQTASVILRRSDDQIRELINRPEAKGMDLRLLSGDAIVQERAGQVMTQYQAMREKDAAGADAWLMSVLNYDPKASAVSPDQAALNAAVGATSVGGRFASPEDAKQALLAAGKPDTLTVDSRLMAALLTPMDKQRMDIARMEMTQRLSQDRTEGSVVRTQLAGLIAARNNAQEQLIKVGFNPTLPAEKQPIVLNYRSRLSRLPEDLAKEVRPLTISSEYYAPSAPPADATATPPPAAAAASSGVALPGVGIIPDKEAPPAPAEYFAPGGAPEPAAPPAPPAPPATAAQSEYFAPPAEESLDWRSMVSGAAGPAAILAGATALSPKGQDAIMAAGRAVARGATTGAQAASKVPSLLARGATAGSEALARGYVQGSNALSRAGSAASDYFTKFEAAPNNRFNVGSIEEAMRARAADIAETKVPVRAAQAEARAAANVLKQTAAADAKNAAAGLRHLQPGATRAVEVAAETAAEKRAALEATKIAAEKAARKASAKGALRVAGAAAGPAAQAFMTGYGIGEAANWAVGKGLNLAMGDKNYQSEGMMQTLVDASMLPSAEEQAVTNDLDSLMSKRAAIIRSNLPLEEKRRLAAPLTERINSLFSTSSYFNQTR